MRPLEAMALLRGDGENASSQALGGLLRSLIIGSPPSGPRRPAGAFQLPDIELPGDLIGDTEGLRVKNAPVARQRVEPWADCTAATDPRRRMASGRSMASWFAEPIANLPRSQPGSSRR